MPANRLNSAALPSITGSAAAGPMLPSPSTADPSVTTATVLRLMVSRRASSGVLRDGEADARDPRGVGHRHVVAGAQRHLRRHLDLAAEVQQEGAVADLVDRDAVDRLQRLRAAARRASWSLAEQVTSTTIRSGIGLGHVERGHDAAGLPDRGGQPPDRSGIRGDLEPDRDRVRRSGDRHARCLRLSAARTNGQGGIRSEVEGEEVAALRGVVVLSPWVWSGRDLWLTTAPCSCVK